MSHGIAISKESLDSILGELRRRDELVDNRYRMVLDRLMPFIPILMSFGMGDKKTVTEDPIVSHFLSTLKSEQISKILEVLDVEQVAELTSIAQRYALFETEPVEAEKPSPSK